MSARKHQPAAGDLRVVAYLRVSTAEQSESGAGLKAQREAIRAAAGQRGWRVVKVVEDAGLSGKSLERPGLTEAITMVEGDKADALVVAKLDRLSRSLLDFAGLMERARRKGWAIVALDLGVDTTTPAGEMMANVLATFSQFERRLIGQRTKDALAVKKAEGVVLGRPRKLSDEVVARIVAMRATGMSLAAIADTLSGEGVPTAQGGARWYSSTVRHVLGYAEE